MRGFSLALVAAVLCGTMCLNPEAAHPGRTVYRSNRDIWVQLLPAGVGAAQWPADGYLPEHGIVCADRHDVWRQRHHQFRAAHRKARFHRDRRALHPMHRAGGHIPIAQLNRPPRYRVPLVGGAPRLRAAMGWASGCICSGFAAGLNARRPDRSPSSRGGLAGDGRFAANAADLQQTGRRGRGNPRLSAGAPRAGTANPPDTGRFRPLFPVTL